MSLPLAMIGPCIVEVLGFNAQEVAWKGEANWPSQQIFQGAPFYQPTGLADETTTLSLAARPHAMGGLDNYAALKEVWRNQDVVPFLRMYGFTAEFVDLVAVKSLSAAEQKIAPDGRGWRWEFSAELLHVGEHAAGGFL